MRCRLACPRVGWFRRRWESPFGVFRRVLVQWGVIWIFLFYDLSWTWLVNSNFFAKVIHRARRWTYCFALCQFFGVLLLLLGVGGPRGSAFMWLDLFSTVSQGYRVIIVNLCFFIIVRQNFDLGSCWLCRCFFQPKSNRLFTFFGSSVIRRGPIGGRHTLLHNARRLSHKLA